MEKKPLTKMEQLRAKRHIIKKITLKQDKKQKINEIGLNQLLKPVLFFVVSLILEIVSFALFNFKTTSGATQILPTYILFDIGIWLFVCGLILCSHKNWISNVVFYFSLVIEIAIFIVNYTIKDGFGYLFSFDMIRLVPEMFAAISLDFINIKLIAICIVGAAFVVALPIVFDKLLKSKKVQLKKISKPIFFLLCFLITSIVGSGCYLSQTMLLKSSSNNEEISSDKYQYENLQIRDLSYQKFGSCGFYFKNLIDCIFGKYSLSDTEKTTLLNEFDSSAVALNTSADLYGDNLIVIMLESLEWFAIDPYNTPNLWALKTGTASENISDQASVFTNYVSNNKTNVSEDLSLLGYMPNECVFTVKSKNTYATKYSLVNLFNNQGYTTSYFHNWTPVFFNRKSVNINLGFQNFYSLNNFQSDNKSTKFNYYNLESDFMDQFIEKIAPTGKSFMSFYTTVATHGTYSVVNDRFSSCYSKYDSNLEQMKTWFTSQHYTYPTSAKDQQYLKEYKSRVIDTDNMIGKLFKHLNDTGLINNTAVVLYADHNAYYEKLSNKIKSTNANDYSNQSTYSVPLMIYSKKLSASTIDTFCSPYDLYPTISTLFGLPYNTTCAQGENIFSSNISNTIYMSYLTGFYNDKCYSKTMQSIKKYSGSTDQEVENFKSNVCKFLKKQKTLETIYYGNYSV